MIQLRTMVVVADNSGAKRAQCIKVLGGHHKRYGRLGDMVVVAIKDAIPGAGVKKGDVGLDRWHQKQLFAGKGANYFLILGVKREKAGAPDRPYGHERQTLNRGPQLLHQSVAAAVINADGSGFQRAPIIRRHAEILLESNI